MNDTIIGVDLAKDVIQVCIYSNQTIQTNSQMTASEFLHWLAKQTPTRIVFEACATSNFWRQKASQLGHQAQLISAKLVETVRQHQKHDSNDALAIVQAALLPDVTFIHGKSTTQQQLQAIMRLRELGVKQRTAIKNQITALLLEFNIRVSNKHGGLKGAVETTLEDADNGLSMSFRAALQRAWHHYLEVNRSIQTYDSCLETSVKNLPDCTKLMAIEGVGMINAINLYNLIACSDQAIFSSGKDVAACIGLTPIQHSSGGKIKLGAIGKHVKNSSLRSQLVTGAFTYVNHLAKRYPKTKKDVWLKALIQRRGKKCAAVALANKTVRTAFAMLQQHTQYRAECISQPVQ